MSIWRITGYPEKYKSLGFKGAEEAIANPRANPNFPLKLLAKRPPISLQEEWVPSEVEPFWDRRRKVKMGHLINVSTSFFALNEQAMDILKPFIANHVEFLPLKCDEEDYTLIHVTNIVTCLDHDKSVIRYSKFGNTPRSVRKYVFDCEQMTDHHIFRLEEDRFVRTFVSDTFKSLVEENGLEGLRFEKIDSNC